VRSLCVCACVCVSREHHAKGNGTGPLMGRQVAKLARLHLVRTGKNTHTGACENIACLFMLSCELFCITMKLKPTG